MKLSRESQYALLGLAYLARQPPGAMLQAAQVAEGAGLPGTFLAKIFRKLTRHGILRSFRGRERGYVLARAPRDISVREIVEAVDGPDVFQRCVFWADACSDEHPCLLHEAWRTVRPVMADLMGRMSLEEVAEGRVVPGVPAPGSAGPAGRPREGTRSGSAGGGGPGRRQQTASSRGRGLMA